MPGHPDETDRAVGLEFLERFERTVRAGDLRQLLFRAEIVDLHAVDPVGPQAAETLLDLRPRPVAAALAGLCREEDLVATLGHHQPDLALAVGVGVGGVDVVDAQVERPVHHRRRLFVRLQVVLHAAQRQDAHVEARPAEGTSGK